MYSGYKLSAMLIFLFSQVILNSWRSLRHKIPYWIRPVTTKCYLSQKAEKMDESITFTLLSSIDIFDVSHLLIDKDKS